MNKIFSQLLVSFVLFIPSLTWADSTSSWTLEKSIQQASKVAPEVKTADAEIGKKLGKLEEADAWPNPSVELQMDNSLGLEVGDDGYDFTRLAITQALPFSRLDHQRNQANAELAGARAQREHQRLLLEYKVAQRFHSLQLAEAKLNLAKQRLEQANRYHSSSHRGTRKDPLIRFLTPLEQMRLDIVQQTAKQSVEVAEGEFNEAVSSFKSLLGMSIQNNLRLVPLSPLTLPNNFKQLENALQRHPALKAAGYDIVSAQAGVDVASSQRYADPTITLFTEEDYFAGRRQQSTGLTLNVQIPLWNKNYGSVTQARYAVYQARDAMELKQRELRTSLHKSYLHLGHLILQAKQYRNKLLNPAQKVFTLTRKGFEAGELNILTLIDANNTYFDAQARYLELLQEAWQEMAEVRKSAGLLLTANWPTTKFAEVD